MKNQIRKAVLLSISILLLFPSISWSQTEENMINQVDNQGLKQGAWEDVAGKNMSKGVYLNDVKEGQWATFNQKDFMVKLENYKGIIKTTLFQMP